MVEVPKEAVSAVEKAAHQMGFAINTFMATVLVEKAMTAMGLVPKFSEPEQQAMLVDAKVAALEQNFGLVLKSLGNIETYLRAVDPAIQKLRESQERDEIIHDLAPMATDAVIHDPFDGPIAPMSGE
jgi:DNA-binding LacI/PurR family transcriptional regulator